MKAAKTAQKAGRPPISSPLRQIMSSSAMLIVMAVLSSLLISAMLVVVFDQRVQESAAYLLAKPSDFFRYAGVAFASFFASLFRGVIFDYQAASTIGIIMPITNSLTRSVPLILAGFSITSAFRTGLFNIGAQGQLLVGAALRVWTDLNTSLPYGLRLSITMLLAVLGGAVWSTVPDILRAQVGANETVVTIMMNSITVFLTSYFLGSWVFIGNGYPGKSSTVPGTAAYPKLLGSTFNLHLDFLIVLLTAVFVWWLLERSTFGFELRAAGANPNAACTAGIPVNRIITLTMIIAGVLAGLAGTGPTLGTKRFLSAGTAGSIGFDAITVALLGALAPLDTALVGALLGVFASGAPTMRAAVGIPVDIVFVSRTVIVLLITAPPLIRRIFRLPEPIDPRIAKQATPPMSMVKMDSKSGPTLAGAPHTEETNTQPEDEVVTTEHETTGEEEAQS